MYVPSTAHPEHFRRALGLVAQAGVGDCWETPTLYLLAMSNPSINRLHEVTIFGRLFHHLKFRLGGLISTAVLVKLLLTSTSSWLLFPLHDTGRHHA